MQLRVPLSALSALLLLTACAPSLGPPPPGARPMPRPTPGPAPGPATFNAADFAWAQAPGRNSVVGKVNYRQGPVRFSCAGAGVVLTPETPWSRRRMAALYGSTERAALPAAQVRDRTKGAPAGDAGPFVKRTTCDGQDRFSFAGLPDGTWYVIALARPLGQPKSDGVALMRRIVTRGGRPTPAEL